MPMQAIRGTRYWMRLEHVTAGELHSCRFGISGSWGPGLDFPGYTDQSYELAGVRPGEIVASRTVHSEIYPNASTNYWLYANAGIDEGRGAPLMIWLDGHVCLDAVDQFGMRMQVVTDNLAHLGLIPPMVHVLVAPSSPGEPLATRFDGEDQANAMRSLQYDEVSDRYGRHLLDEVLPDAGRLVKLRADAYSRGASGGSSGGVCAFKLGWFHDHEFSRVHSVIGSFTGLQWDPDSDLPGGFMYANLVRREQRRNIRVWLSDGSNDFEVGPEGRRDFFIAGSWPLNNIMLANALKLAGYDFRFRFGNGYHTGGQQSLDLPESLAWLWHGYDPERTEERFEQAAAEREQPPFRVQITNRDT